MALAFYIDEHVPDAITRGLRRRGVDVLRVQDNGQSNTDDGLILDEAMRLGRVVFTQDRDFLRHAQTRQATGVPFAGVVYAEQLLVTIGQCVRELEYMAAAGYPADMADKVEYLPL